MPQETVYNLTNRPDSADSGVLAIGPLDNQAEGMIVDYREGIEAGLAALATQFKKQMRHGVIISADMVFATRTASDIRYAVSRADLEYFCSELKKP